MAHQWKGVIEEYRDRLPVTRTTPVVTLREGGTPLIAARTLSERTGCDVWLKFEGANPTGSFKDRGMTMAISKAAEAGAKAVICASTGNTSASAAAYAAAAGMACAVLVPDGKIAMGKLSQAVAHGAHLLQVDGNFDDCLTLARKLAEAYPVELVNSVNPYRIEGQKTASFEIVDLLGDAPDVHCLPVGNAGNITAYWKGYVEYTRDAAGASAGGGVPGGAGVPAGAGADAGGGAGVPAGAGGGGVTGPGVPGPATKRPRMWGYQAAGAAPIVLGHPVTHPETIATAIRIGNPASWSQAVTARDESGGLIDAVTDEEILAAHRLLSASEGVFVEPASAASVAGLLNSHAAGLLDPGQVVVCTVTGHGLKDPQWALRRPDGSPVEPTRVPVDAATVARSLGLQA